MQFYFSLLEDRWLNVSNILDILKIHFHIYFATSVNAYPLNSYKEHKPNCLLQKIDSHYTVPAVVRVWDFARYYIVTSPKCSCLVITERDVRFYFKHVVHLTVQALVELLLFSCNSPRRNGEVIFAEKSICAYVVWQVRDE